MNLKTLAIALLLAAGLSACLSAPPADVEGPPETPTTPETPLSPTTPVEATTPLPPALLNALCPSNGADPAAHLMAFPYDGEAVMVTASGAFRTLTEATALAPPSAAERTDIQLRPWDGGVAVTVNWGTWNDPSADAALSVFSTDGGLLWRVDWPGHRGSIDAVGYDGSVVATRSPSASVYVPGERLLLYPDGREVLLPVDFYPIAGLASHGHIPGHLGKEIGWLDPATGAFTIVGLDPAVLDGERLVTRDLESHTARLVVSTPGLPLEFIDIDGASADGLHVDNTTSEGWLLLSDGWRSDRGHYRVDLRSGQVDHVQPAVEGWTVLEHCFGQSAVVDASGRVTMMLRNGAEARAFRSDSDLGAWEPVGRPLTGIVTAQLEVAGDTLLLRSMGRNETYCPDLEWDDGASADALVGSAIQVLGEDGTVAPLQGFTGWHTVQPSPDGLCAAYVDPGDTAGTDPQVSTLQVLDVPTGRVATIDVESAWVSWLP